MAETAPNPRQYYLGVNGEQKGPYSDSVLLEMLEKGEIPEGALIWYEGLANWQPFREIPELKRKKSELVSSPPSPAPKKEPVDRPKYQRANHSLNPTEGEAASFSASETLKPIFDEGRANLSGASFANQRIVFISLGVLGLVALGAAGFLWWAAYANKATQGKMSPPRQSIEAMRQIQLSQAITEMATDGEGAASKLRELFKANPNDKIGKEAVEVILDYYKRQQRPLDVARFLLEAKRPAEAVKLFLEDPSASKEAEGALEAAAEASQGKEKKEFFLKQIKLLLGPADNFPKAIERIKALEKNFPGEPHPYGYYLKSVDERIADIFSRISFHFISTLYAFLPTELPQINFINRPLVEVKKNRSEEYRILASYKGEILLNQDRLRDIYFVFWLLGDQWAVVDTNLTKERNKYAAAEREKHKSVVMTAEETLRYLESVFKAQFPKSGLHEVVSPHQKIKEESTLE